MDTNPRKPNRIWALIIVLLVTITVVSVGITWSRYQPARPIEITLPTEKEFKGNIEISGAVTNPGIYPFTQSDSIGTLIQSAGGASSTAEPAGLKLVVPEASDQQSPQKVNINRADAWLLEALPGIGATRAKTIIAYREQNGPFKQTSDLMKVEGIGQAVYEQIKSLITVTD